MEFFIDLSLSLQFLKSPFYFATLYAPSSLLERAHWTDVGALCVQTQSDGGYSVQPVQ